MIESISLENIKHKFTLLHAWSGKTFFQLSELCNAGPEQLASIVIDPKDDSIIAMFELCKAFDVELEEIIDDGIKYVKNEDYAPDDPEGDPDHFYITYTSGGNDNEKTK